MSTLVEKMARQMAAAEGWRWDDNRQMLDCAAAGIQNTSRERDVWRNRARAALRAMREPSIAQRHVCTFEEAEITWPRMVDAAIQEHSTTPPRNAS